MKSFRILAVGAALALSSVAALAQDFPSPTLLMVAANSPLRTVKAETGSRLAAQGLELRSLKPDELAAFGRTEMLKWSELVKRSGAQVD